MEKDPLRMAVAALLLPLPFPLPPQPAVAQEEPTVTLVLTQDTVEEGGTVSLRAELDDEADRLYRTGLHDPGCGLSVSLGIIKIFEGDTTRTWRSVTARNDAVDAPDRTCSISGVSFNPGVGQGGVILDSVTLTVQDNDDEPKVTLVLSPALIAEDGGTSGVTASLFHPSSEDTAVTVSATPVAPAVEGDYALSANRMLTVPAGMTKSTGTVTITSVDNAAETPDRMVTVSATATNDQGIVGPDDVMLTIEDDDMPRLSIDDARVAEGDADDTPMTFTVRLTPAAKSVVTVDWATSDGTATAGTDYTEGRGSLRFDPGETEKTVTVTGDDVHEPDETFGVVLDNVQGAAIRRGRGRSGTTTRPRAFSRGAAASAQRRFCAAMRGVFRS